MLNAFIFQIKKFIPVDFCQVELQKVAELNSKLKELAKKEFEIAIKKKLIFRDKNFISFAHNQSLKLII
jgi:hypothetical protein